MKLIVLVACAGLFVGGGALLIVHGLQASPGALVPTIPPGAATIPQVSSASHPPTTPPPETVGRLDAEELARMAVLERDAEAFTKRRDDFFKSVARSRGLSPACAIMNANDAQRRACQEARKLWFLDDDGSVRKVP